MKREETFMANKTNHDEAIARLRKIEGQVRGVREMIEDSRDSMDILQQIRAVASAIKKVDDLVMHRYLETCVTESIKKGSRKAKETKIRQIMDLFSRFRK